jgi:outer membrane lipoprotein-sorting protein
MIKIWNRKSEIRKPKVQTQKSTTTNTRCGAFLIFNFSFLILLSGCASTRSLPPAPQYTTASEFLHILSTRYDSLRSLKTRAKVTLKIDGVRENRAAAGILYQAPDQLRIDMAALGMSFMTAIANQNTLEIYLPRDNNYLTGPPEKVLDTLTGVNLAYYSLIQAILGLPNLSPLDLPRVTLFKPGKNQLYLELTYPLWKRRLIFEPRSATLLEDYVFNLEGALISKRLLSGYHQSNGFVLPKHIEMHQGADLIAIDVETHQSNVEVLGADFHMRVPGDVTRHTIE